MRRGRGKCKYCGVTIRLVWGVWVHSWQSWQSGWCHEGGERYGRPLGTRAEPTEEEK